MCSVLRMAVSDRRGGVWRICVFRLSATDLTTVVILVPFGEGFCSGIGLEETLGREIVV